MSTGTLFIFGHAALNMLNELGVSRENIGLFERESVVVPFEVCLDLQLQRLNESDIFFHKFTNIVFEVEVGTRRVLNLYLADQSVALLLHAWIRGYRGQKISGIKKAFFVKGGTKVGFEVPEITFMHEGWKKFFKSIVARWSELNKGSDTHWKDFQVEWAWLDLICKGKCENGHSTVIVRHLRLAPLTHDVWSLNTLIKLQIESIDADLGRPNALPIGNKGDFVPGQSSFGPYTTFKNGHKKRVAEPRHSLAQGLIAVFSKTPTPTT